jgi:hypothetical protein
MSWVADELFVGAEIRFQLLLHLTECFGHRYLPEEKIGSANHE